MVLPDEVAKLTIDNVNWVMSAFEALAGWCFI